MFRRLSALGLLLAAAATAAAQNKVHYQPHATAKYLEIVGKKDAPLEGVVVKESPAGVVIKTAGKNSQEVLVPPEDVLVIEYEVSKGMVSEFRSPLFRIVGAQGPKVSAADRQKALTQAIGDLKKLDLKGYSNARRYVQFKIAEATALLSQDDKTTLKRDEAIKLLDEFRKENATSWTIVPALKTLAKLQEDAKMQKEAAKTYEELANVPGLPKELRQQAEVLVGRLLLRGGDFATAQSRLEKLAATLSDGEAQKPFVLAYLAEARISQNRVDGVQAQLEGIIKSSSDPKLRAVAYNLLGDLHRAANRIDDAFWAYLRVDALYNDDAEEQAKALYYLSTLYATTSKPDPARGRECEARLRDPRFAGTPWRRRLPPDETVKEEPPKTKDKDVKKDKDKK